MRKRILSAALRWLAVVLILRVLSTILSNYPDYFPPRFDSLFLQGREATFDGTYRVAFYLHIVSGPIVLINGLFLLIHQGRAHRWLGRIQAALLMFILLPTGAIMAANSFGGWAAGLSFLLLSAATACCTILGVVRAVQARFEAHRRWMLRSHVLICSAVLLRLISGAAGLIGVEEPETAYIVAAWISWLIPLAVFEAISPILRATSPGVRTWPSNRSPSASAAGPCR